MLSCRYRRIMIERMMDWNGVYGDGKGTFDVYVCCIEIRPPITRLIRPMGVWIARDDATHRE